MTIENPRKTIENHETFSARLVSFPQEDQYRLEFAYNIGKSAHRKNPPRFSGERYFEHPRATALILLDECRIANPAIICAALLHDTLEDTGIFGNGVKLPPDQFETISRILITMATYPETAEMVWAVTEPHIDGVQVSSKEQAKEKKYRRLREGSEESLLVKMADRLHNLRTFVAREGELTPEARIRETEEILIPIFERAKNKYFVETNYLLSEIQKAIAALRQKYSLKS